MIQKAVLVDGYRFDEHEAEAWKEDDLLYLKIYQGSEIGDSVNLELQITEDPEDDPTTVTVSLTFVSL